MFNEWVWFNSLVHWVETPVWMFCQILQKTKEEQTIIHYTVAYTTCMYNNIVDNDIMCNVPISLPI